jgi:hypothetical protein
MVLGGFHAAHEAIEFLGQTDSSPAMRIFAGGSAELLRHKAGLPQSLFIDHRHLSRHGSPR